jgi:hypothetical protein
MIFFQGESWLLLALVETAFLARKRLAKQADFWVSVAIIFLTGIIFSVRVYLSWLRDEIGRYLLPPHQPIFYFLFYSGFRFFIPYALSLIIALIFVLAMNLLNRRGEEKFFEKEEPWLAGLAIFLSGHPGWLIYLSILLVVYLFAHFFERIRGRKDKRISLYHLWIPVGLFVILINVFWLSRCFWWLKLKI